MKLIIVPLLLAVALLVSCGKEESVSDEAPAPAPKPVPIPGPELEGFAAIEPIMDKYCARCHSEDFLTDETAFLTSNARQRVGNKSMPLIGSAEAKTLSEADRAKITNFK